MSHYIISMQRLKILIESLLLSRALPFTHFISLSLSNINLQCVNTFTLGLIGFWGLCLLPFMFVHVAVE